jgi:osmotically-inducible protein OsmY
MSAERGDDRRLLQRVTQQLTTRGIRNPCHVDAAVKNGDVTLTGTIQYEHQRKAAMQAATGVTGVKRVSDRMTVKPAVKR